MVDMSIREANDDRKTMAEGDQARVIQSADDRAAFLSRHGSFLPLFS